MSGKFCYLIGLSWCISAGCPLIARAYALQFAQNDWSPRPMTWQTATTPIRGASGSSESRAGRAQGANTWHATRAIQEAREAMRRRGLSSPRTG